MALLQTEALTRRFGRLTAVDRLTVAVGAGETFGLVGPNGVLFAVMAALVAVGARLYPNVAT